MFSFHKPKIYRSNNGCCICRAKSSSSRFTDSKKYEESFERCFLIKEIRTGEICNACVLLVKRCKKLPSTSTRHWSHVVDARQGHKSNNKTKPTTQINSNNNTNLVSSNKTNRILNKDEKRKICIKLFNNNLIVNENESNNILNEQKLNECDCSSCIFNRELDTKEQLNNNIRRLKKTLTPKKLTTESNSSSGNSSDSNDEDEDYVSDNEKLNNLKILSNEDNKMVTRSGQTINSFIDQTIKSSNKIKSKRKQAVNKIQQRNDSTFLDMNYWKREQICCGIIFKNKTNDMVLIDRHLYTPCSCRKQQLKTQLNDKMDIEILNNQIDKNNNLINKEQIKEANTELITVNIPNQIDEQINELIVNSSSGISSDGSSITEDEEDSSSSNNLISDHDFTKNITIF